MAMHAMSFPSTLSAGDPYAALASTPGNASPISRTVSKSIVFLGMGPLTWAVIINESLNPFQVSPDRSADPNCQKEDAGRFRITRQLGRNLNFPEPDLWGVE